MNDRRKMSSDDNKTCGTITRAEFYKCKQCVLGFVYTQYVVLLIHVCKLGHSP